MWDAKEVAIRNHFDKVAWSDCILVINPEKNTIPSYIGANTLLEMGLAFHLRKPIYVLYNIPELGYKEEILGMKPVCLHEDLSVLK